jgi:hypothetical protein
MQNKSIHSSLLQFATQLSSSAEAVSQLTFLANRYTLQQHFVYRHTILSSWFSINKILPRLSSIITAWSDQDTVLILLCLLLFVIRANATDVPQP